MSQVVERPSVFANAPRYHGGGIAGLRPNEIPAILERGERIIAADGGRMGGDSFSLSMPISIEATGDNSAQVTQAILAKVRAELPSQVIRIVRDARDRAKV